MTLFPKFSTRQPISRQRAGLNAIPQLLLIVLLSFTGQAKAETYMGFDLGNQEHSAVTEQLSSAGAQFNDKFGYKGYGVDLPMIKVEAYSLFSKYGAFKEGWLSFTPEHKLYQIDVLWSDAGNTFTMLKDALDTKYGAGRQSGSGFKQSFAYADKDVSIDLVRNTFGFGSDQSTGLVYTFKPALPSVEMRRELVEQDIRRRNAEKAGADL